MTDDDELEIFVDLPLRTGVWANDVRIVFSRHEFTLDFLRLDHGTGDPPRLASLAARVAVSSPFVLTLMRRLQAAWADYAAEQLPPEARP